MFCCGFKQNTNPTVSFITIRYVRKPFEIQKS
jgi:hypothetical protein